MSIAPDKHERHLVAFMTPIFKDRLMSSLSNDYVLVNSEGYRWIPQSSGLKANYVSPHHFIAPHYLVEFKPPYKDGPPCDGEYGTFPVFEARQSLVAIVDAKGKLNDQSEGQFMKYLMALSFPSDDGFKPLYVLGFVYDWERCTLMTAIQGFITQITTVKWTTPGSLDLIRNYFQNYESDWHDGLKLACDNLGVTLPRYSSVAANWGQCILGAGAFGRVFEVLRGEQRLALKLGVGEENCDELDTEYFMNERVLTAAKSIVIGIEGDSLWSGTIIRPNATTVQVAAFRLSTIGIPFRHFSEVTDEYGPLILEALSDLHSVGGICHGDARYKNESSSYGLIYAPMCCQRLSPLRAIL